MTKILDYIRAYHQLGVFHLANKERVRMLHLAFSYVRDEKVHGDYHEFGVARGRTFIAAFHLAKKYKLKMIFFAYDSFKGFPKPEGRDAEFERFSEGEENWPQWLFEKNLKKKKVDLNYVKIIPGFFKESLKSSYSSEKESECNIAIAWIDCDMYSSTKLVLDFIYHRLICGSILIFDDWYCYRGDPLKGEQGATNEWLSNHPDLELIQFRKFATVGNSFIVNFKK